MTDRNVGTEMERTDSATRLVTHRACAAYTDEVSSTREIVDQLSDDQLRETFFRVLAEWDEHRGLHEKWRSAGWVVPTRLGRRRLSWRRYRSLSKIPDLPAPIDVMAGLSIYDPAAVETWALRHPARQQSARPNGRLGTPLTQLNDILQKHPRSASLDFELLEMLREIDEHWRSHHLDAEPPGHEYLLLIVEEVRQLRLD